MPYRIDVARAPANALDVLVRLGALDVDVEDGCLAAIVPDTLEPGTVSRALGVTGVTVSPATARDDGSVWWLRPHVIRAGPFVIAPAHVEAPAGAIRLQESRAFGTGLHATTALCLEMLGAALESGVPPALLDVGTGTGILALAALRGGVSRATGLDVDAEAITAAAANARLNGVADRLDLLHGGPEVTEGTWPLVIANIQAGPLIELAPVLVRRLGRRSRLILSGFPGALAGDVEAAYRWLGMRRMARETRAGWCAVTLASSW